VCLAGVAGASDVFFWAVDFLTATRIKQELMVGAAGTLSHMEL